MPPVKLVLTRPGYSELFAEEARDRWQLAGQVVGPAAVAFADAAALPALSDTVFGRQLLPAALLIEGQDLAAAAATVLKRLEVMAKRSNRQTGQIALHAYALDDDPATKWALHLEKAVLAGIKERLPQLQHRLVEPEALVAVPPARHDLLLQLYADGPRTWLSTASFAAGVSPYIGGNLRMRGRAGAPSRSARKLEEAFTLLGRSPQPGETAVDLGAAPGGWSFSLARHGAIVTAVDHGELELPPNKQLQARIQHVKADGLTYQPEAAVDWLCSDMLVGSRIALELLAGWLERGQMQHFVVNMKLPQAKPWPIIKEALALLQVHAWPVMRAKHLYHDRREITLLGSRQVLPT